MKSFIAVLFSALCFGVMAQPIPPPVIYPITVVKGGTGGTTAPDDNLLIGSGTAWVRSTIPDCPDAGGNHLNYTQSTNTLSCGVTASGGGPTIITKPTDTTRNSTTAPVADPALQLSLVANTRNVITLFVWYTSDSTPDFRWATTNSATTTSSRANCISSTFGGAVSSAVNSTSAAIPSQSVTGTTGTGMLECTIVIQTTSTGVFAFNWAQDTSNAADTTVKAGSYISYTSL